MRINSLCGKEVILATKAEVLAVFLLYFDSPIGISVITNQTKLLESNIRDTLHILMNEGTIEKEKSYGAFRLTIPVKRLLGL